MDRLRAFASRHGLDIYEDAAQALGSRYKGVCAGNFGRAACISFYPAKVLGCLGDGGAVITNDENIHRKLLLLRDHGRDKDGDVAMWGFNSRLDNLQAAFLAFQFEDYPAVVARRRAIAAIYQERLGDNGKLSLPPGPDGSPDHFDIYQNYEIESERRDELKAFLKDRGVGTLIQWGGRPVHSFARLGFSQRLPKTDRFFTRCIMLPLNMSMVDDDVHYVCDKVLEFHSGH
jgi:dTDP-4-amino-4,6-dideoxygalactose transaminase